MEAQQEVEMGWTWMNPDPLAAIERIRALPLNDEQLAAATSDPDKPKIIRAGKAINISAHKLFFKQAT